MNGLERGDLSLERRDAETFVLCEGSVASVCLSVDELRWLVTTAGPTALAGKAAPPADGGSRDGAAAATVAAGGTDDGP
jgi:hypothetical protein